MKASKIESIIDKHYPINERMKSTVFLPSRLAAFAEFCFKQNLQGPDIDEIREFLIKFDDCKEYIEN